MNLFLYLFIYFFFKKKNKSKIPFAIVGSDKEVELPDGRRVRGRKYPWGVIEVDNEEHNDFVKLRQMLIRLVFYHCCYN
jgi:septin family protein